MDKKYRVTLSAAERDKLTALISKGKAAVRKLTHAPMLLQVEESKAEAGSTDDPADCAGLFAAVGRKATLNALRLTVSYETVRQILKKRTPAAFEKDAGGCKKNCVNGFPQDLKETLRRINGNR